MDTEEPISIAIVGGTGNMGIGLATLFGRAGYKILIGSRNLQKSQAVANQLNKSISKGEIIGLLQEDAVSSADIVIISVPIKVHRQTISKLSELLKGKLVIDVTVPLDPSDPTKFVLPKAGSAGLETQELIGENGFVVDAFQHVSAKLLLNNTIGEVDILVCGSPESARYQAIELIKSAGLRAVDAGGLENSAVIESLTPILIYMNKIYRKKDLGIKIQGL